MVINNNQEFPLFRQQKQKNTKTKKPELNIQLGDLEHYSAIME